MKNIQPKIGLVITIILSAAFFRLIPHWPNFTPMAAIALMGGALLRNKWVGFGVPVLAMIVSDILTITLINYKFITIQEYFSSPGTMLIYASILVMTGVGYLIRNKISVTSLSFGAGSTAVLFFLISNFGAWLTNSLPKTAAGLLATYELGIPFFANNLAGNLFYTFLLFGIAWKASQVDLQTAKSIVK